MDRLNQIQGEAGDTRDSTLDTSSPPSEAFMSVNESSSKYYSLSEVDSTFSISPSKDTAGSVADSDRTITGDAEILSTLSPIQKSDIDTYKIGKHIEAANILSGGVNIFDDNDNSYDGDELVIDDNVTLEDEKTNVELKLAEGAVVALEKTEDILPETVDEANTIESKDTEVVLQIDGKNVDAIDIGNGLYLYRKAGEEELAAVQIIEDDQQQPSFKFLKVRENTEGNLEVYEEIEVEIPKEQPIKDGRSTEKQDQLSIKAINKVINDPTCNKILDKIDKEPKIEANSTCTLTSESGTDGYESKSEVNLNGKMVKFNESRKSPLIGTFTPMTYHSTPNNKERIPLTKTMVNQQLHPSRHSDNIKKTIEVHTENSKPKVQENTIKPKEFNENSNMITITQTEEIESQTNVIGDNQSLEIEDKSTAMEVKNVLSEHNKDSEDSMVITSVPENKKYITKSSEHTKVHLDCIDVKDYNVSKEIKNPNGEITTINQKEISTANNELIQPQEQLESVVTKSEELNKKSGNEDIDIYNNICQDINSLSANEIAKNENIDSDTHESKVNMSVTDDSLDKTISTEVALTVNTVDEKNEQAVLLKHHNEDNAIQFVSPVIDQILPVEVTKSSPKADLNINAESTIKVIDETKSENSNIKDTTKNVINEPAFDTITNNIVKFVDSNKEACLSVKKEFKSLNMFKLNKEIRNECDNSESDISNNKNVTLEQCDFQNVTAPVTKSSDLQTENVNCSKVVIEKVQDTHKANTKDALCIESAVGLTSTHKAIFESQTTIKTDCANTKLLNDNLSEVAPKSKITLTKANNFNNAVPFGKWTEAHRQEFLNKIKEVKIPSNYSNTNQIKQTNDLNRRDVLKKFDSQRQSTVNVTAKSSDFGSVPKFSSKMDTPVFLNKATVIQQTNPLNLLIPVLLPSSSSFPVKTEMDSATHNQTVIKKDTKEEPLSSEMLVQRTIINSQELIDKTIEGIITKAIKVKVIPDHMKDQKTIHTVENPKDATPLPGSLDDIEMKMNELHGISFSGPPFQEPTPLHSIDIKTPQVENLNLTKNIKVPKLLPFKTKNQQGPLKDIIQDDISDEEIIEHEPITGDSDVSKQKLITLLSGKEKPSIETKKDAIITEVDFDKFARRNSITYENCLTVNFENKEQHNVVQTLKEKEPSVKKLSRNELLLAESKAKSSNKQNAIARQNNHTSKIPTLKSTSEEDVYSKHYQSRVQIAYHSALTAKRHLECPITIIEDKPVKVVYMDTNTEFSPTLLNVQGQELSPSKNQKNDYDDMFVHSASESLDSDILDSTQDNKCQDETKVKSKHQRKQVLTPVHEEPEIQLIEPADLGIKVSSTKKRRVEDKCNKTIKNLVPKKSYLLNRRVADEHITKPHQPNNLFKDTDNRKDSFMGHTDTITAIDNLVKAAELIETQSENNTNNIAQADISQETPVKRGRGRPRKNPLPETVIDRNISLSPHKKPRLIDAVKKRYTDSEDSSDGEIIKENWTMGKINENIVCPICNKLFRSENVVFKHVKHCTGPSPNRSDSDKRSPRRLRSSQESDEKDYDSKSEDSDSEEEEIVRNRSSKNDDLKSINGNDDVIAIKDRPLKKLMQKTKFQHNTNVLMCEFCGKTFRQLSYLVNHKLIHKSEDNKKNESEHETNISVFVCEVCNKKFRKLHHLVQHRNIHNTNSIASRVLRKSSSEQQENKISKKSDDASAGFRCEPCDKSFRKLHHLVEHRETHDGINKKGNAITMPATTESTKSSLAHHCDICKKIFKKLEDLMEHKEQHFDTSSEKSDDKSVKSSLSTKDIIHECSLCYMVFPNEHSLNKHTVFCLRKKKQSAAKQAAKQVEGEEMIDADNIKSDEDMPQDIESIKNHQIEDSVEIEKHQEVIINMHSDENEEKLKVIENEPIKESQETQDFDVKPCDLDPMPKKRHSNEAETLTSETEIPAKIRKTEEKTITLDTSVPKKKIINKEKMVPVAAKRHKIVNVPVINDRKPLVEPSDDDEIRYMLNPNFKKDSFVSKVFMENRPTKRTSLQLERPNPKDLVRRRISLQHPPKMPRLKAKPVEARISVDKKIKSPVTEPSTDSDDSDVKYSFPERSHTEVASKITDKKLKREFVTTTRKSLNEHESITTTRKSLTAIAKRKSLGKLPTPNKPKKRAEVEHRCDCGELFSSAALLSRHTSLAHTPPRIRRRRSPAPDTSAQPTTKPINNKPVNTKQLNTKPSNAKPANTKPSNTKPPNAKQPISKIPVNKAPNVKSIARPAISKPITKQKSNTQKPKCDISNSNLGISLRSGHRGASKLSSH